MCFFQFEKHPIKQNASEVWTWGNIQCFPLSFVHQLQGERKHYSTTLTLWRRQHKHRESLSLSPQHLTRLHSTQENDVMDSELLFQRTKLLSTLWLWRL